MSGHLVNFWSQNRAPPAQVPFPNASLASSRETQGAVRKVRMAAFAAMTGRARRRMGERSATHRFFPARNTSMGNASLTHPTICPLSEIPMHAKNDRDEGIAIIQIDPVPGSDGLRWRSAHPTRTMGCGQRRGGWVAAARRGVGVMQMLATPAVTHYAHNCVWSKKWAKTPDHARLAISAFPPALVQQAALDEVLSPF